MQVYAKTALVGHDWVKDALITCANGVISQIQTGVAPPPDSVCVDVILPALANLHSHAFQRAMAGMTEFGVPGKGSFWTWRTLMYRFLDHLTPEHYEAIAALTYLEMLESGYASVGEFHYVHHQSGGRPYDTLTELSDRVFAAAHETGIGLTHLPVLYSYGDVQQQPLDGGQLRFGNDLERYQTLRAGCAATLKHMPDDTRLGMAPHSLRAIAPDDLARLLQTTPNGPIHIHIAEQPAEVSRVMAALGQRPVDWLLTHADVDRRWCLVHATHMTPPETIALAQSGAVAGLCPITEANLGDGPFNGPTYLAHGGVFGIGTDSNVRISMTEELRMLEYSQRLRDMARNVLIRDRGSVGETLYLSAARGGAQALGRRAGTIATGMLADMVAIDRSASSLCALRDDQLLDGLCFAADDRVVTDTWAAGRHLVRSGRHIARDAIVRRYRAAVTDLLNNMA